MILYAIITIIAVAVTLAWATRTISRDSNLPADMIVAPILLAMVVPFIMLPFCAYRLIQNRDKKYLLALKETK